LDRAAFCCGVPDLDNFFRDHAADHHQAHKARCNMAIQDGRIIGFYWLTAQSYPIDRISPEAMEAFTHLEVTPCVYLGMIATDLPLQGQGLGKALMLDAMAETLAIADKIGVYALTLEAIDQSTADRYEKWGFQYFMKGKLMMYMGLQTIREALA